MGNLSGAGTTAYNNYHTSSLEHYNQNHQYHSINQSLLRNLNYSILQGELEQEAALEDMHMFFVAFQKRQKKIVSQVEDEKDKQLNELEDKEIADSKVNVVPLEKEIELEWA